MKCISSLQCSFGGWWRKVWMEGCGRQYYHYYYHYYYICSLFDSLPPVFIYIYIYISHSTTTTTTTTNNNNLNSLSPFFEFDFTFGRIWWIFVEISFGWAKADPSPFPPCAQAACMTRRNETHLADRTVGGNQRSVGLGCPSEKPIGLRITLFYYYYYYYHYYHYRQVWWPSAFIQPSTQLYIYISIYLYIYRSIYLSYIDNPLFPTNTSKLLPTYLFPTYLISIYFITAIVVVFVLRTHSWKTPSPAWKVSGRILELTRLTAYLTLPYLTLPYLILPLLIIIQTYTVFLTEVTVMISVHDNTFSFQRLRHVTFCYPVPSPWPFLWWQLHAKKPPYLATLVQYSTEKAGKSLFNCQKRLVVL